MYADGYVSLNQRSKKRRGKRYAKSSVFIPIIDNFSPPPNKNRFFYFRKSKISIFEKLTLLFFDSESLFLPLDMTRNKLHFLQFSF